jgi:hypothetical protein
MFRPLTTWCAILLACAGRVGMAQEPPPLEAPAAEQQANPSQSSSLSNHPKPIPSAPAPAAAALPAQSRPRATSTTATQIRPLLVVPGVTAPFQGVETKPKASSASTGVLLPLTGPINGVSAAANTSNPASRRSLPPSPGGQVPGSSGTTGGPPPILLERIEDEPEMKAPLTAPIPGQSNRQPPRSAPPGARTDSSPTPSSNAPFWRPPGVLGRLFGPLPQPLPRNGDAEIRSNRPSAANGANRAEPSGDATAKRRIEQQIYSALGDKLRSVEVRVNGRNVLIVARPNRFWQKRSIRRTLETLPVLEGYRARIDVSE